MLELMVLRLLFLEDPAEVFDGPTHVEKDQAQSSIDACQGDKVGPRDHGEHQGIAALPAHHNLLDGTPRQLGAGSGAEGRKSRTDARHPLLVKAFGKCARDHQTIFGKESTGFNLGIRYLNTSKDLLKLVDPAQSLSSGSRR